MFDHTSLPSVAFRMSALCSDSLHPTLRGMTHHDKQQPKAWVLQSNEAACRVHTHLEASHQKCLKWWVNYGQFDLSEAWLQDGSRSNICWRLPWFHQRQAASRADQADPRLIRIRDSNGFCQTKRWRPHLHWYPPLIHLFLHWILKVSAATTVKLQRLGRLQSTWRNSSWTQRCYRNPADVFSCQWNFPGAFLLWGSVRICEACYIETIWNLQGEGSHVKHSCNAKHIAAQRKEHLRSCHFKMQLLNSAILDPLSENLLNVMATIKLQQPAASGFSLEADTLQLKVLRAMLTWHDMSAQGDPMALVNIHRMNIQFRLYWQDSPDLTWSNQSMLGYSPS